MFPITLKASPINEIFYSMIGESWHLIWIIAFSACIGQTNQNDCQGKMWDYSQVSVWLYVFQAILNLILVLLNILHYCQRDNKKGEGKSSIAYIRVILTFPIFASWLVVLILCCIAYGDSNACPSLHSIILAYIITSFIALGLMKLIFILNLFVVKKKIKQPEEVKPNHQQPIDTTAREVFKEGPIPTSPDNLVQIKVGINDPVSPGAVKTDEKP